MASCATAVAFTVAHPPLVDLRGVNSITVIPFEWDSARAHESFSKQATSALINGVMRSGLDFADPYSLRNIYGLNYRSYADAYIAGRIINVISDSRLETRDEISYRDELIRRYFTVSTVSVTIEYTYIRSADNKELGYFRKTETRGNTFEHPEWRFIDTSYRRPDRGSGSPSRSRPDRGSGSPSRSRPGQGSRGHSDNRSGRRQERRGAPYPPLYPPVFQQADSRAEGIAASAIQGFAYTMGHELDPWATTEERRIKGPAGRDKQISLAKKLIRRQQYREALDLYEQVYERDNTASAAYNTAVLLQATDNFALALEVLESMDGRLAQSGKKSPAFIAREIDAIKGFINGFNILKAYAAREAAPGPPAAPEAGRNFAAEKPAAGDFKEDAEVVEYEYDEGGNATARRYLKNGALERLVLIDGDNEIEELYINGVLALKAYWENGRKVREERMRR